MRCLQICLALFPRPELYLCLEYAIDYRYLRQTQGEKVESKWVNDIEGLD